MGIKKIVEKGKNIAKMINDQLKAEEKRKKDLQQYYREERQRRKLNNEI